MSTISDQLTHLPHVHRLNSHMSRLMLSRWMNNRSAAALMMIGSFFVLVQMSSYASIQEMRVELPDEYLTDEFDWSMIVFVPDTKNYLDYVGSSLHPITKVCVNFNDHTTDGARGNSYEEFWYHNGEVLGMRRHKQIDVAPDSDGAVIICESRNTDSSDASAAVTDALMRLVLDIQFRGALVSHFIIPETSYDGVTKALERYGFAVENPNSDSQFGSLSLRLRTYPHVRDEIFVLRN